MATWLLFLIPSFIWGTTWLTIKFQLGSVAPELSVVYRFALASVALFVWCGLQRVSLRFDARTHGSLALLGSMTYGLNYVLVYSAEKYLTSGLIAVIYVLIVFWNMLGARIFFGTALPRAALSGGLVGLAGVTLVFWPEVAHLRAGPREVRGIVLAVAGSLAASAGNLYSQRVYTANTAVTSSTAWAMGYAAVGVATSCLLRGIPFTFDVSFEYLASLAYLALLGSAVAFITYLTLLRRIGVGPAGYTSAVIPVLAMITSTLFEGYRWSLTALAGIVLVGFGTVLVLRSREATIRLTVALPRG